MNLVHTSRKKVLALVVAVAMLATLITPLSASAYTIDDSLVPTEPMEVDNNIIKIGAHAAATTAVHYLGGNLVTERGSDFDKEGGAYGEGENSAGLSAAQKLENAKSGLNLTIFGSKLTSNPDPYLWNYFYNLYADANNKEKSNDAVYLIPQQMGPTSADTTIIEELGTSYTLDRRPEILYGIGNDTQNYNSLIEDIRAKDAKEGDANYNPIQVQAKSGSIVNQTETMYDLAKAMNQVEGKHGRYGDPMEIAKKYERLQKGLQLYVMSKIASGEIQKKKVAVIDAAGSGTEGLNNRYAAFTSDVSQGTADSQRAAEYAENVSDNLVNVLNVKDEGSEGAPVYYLTAEQLKQADVIITIGQRNTPTTEEGMTEKLRADGWTDEDLKDVSFFTTAPDGIFGIVMNSVENVMGIPVILGSLYPETVNMYHGAMYIYENFWHTDSANLNALINANFNETGVDVPQGVTAAGYDSNKIEQMVDEGFAYYSAHASSIKQTNPKLVPTENLGIKEAETPTTPTKTSIRNATITGVPSKASAYTGKRKKPNVKVVLGAKTLRNGTDYKVTYSNNLRPGRATITVTGIGNYTDTKKAYFNISPKKASMKKTKVKKNRRLTVTWKRQTMATGYQVVVGTNRATTKNRKVINVTRNKTTSKTFKKLKRGKRYYVKVRAYKKINGKKVYGAYSKVKKSAKIKR
ncbi:fibronectin type III domain-containing protein [Zhenpiania hominis]|uniref:Fibronectin type III domain-containing protein n=1 Tax=Zhenpiania hominis TaxID=2763644 RepID=A0A923NMQ8_9FIRM|nr:fibronectin type III domain-containing protein [Zhenpiania hominis]MBC6679400.1 fibronectin type III domain-containing protein [Zhenpiania hominis]